MPKVTQQYLDARREHILSAARRCFLRDGFHATSMQDLFAEAGLSSGAVYRYFPSKDDLIIAIAAANMQEVVALVHTIATQQPGRSVGAVLAELLTIVRAKHDEDGLGGLALLVWAEALRNPSLAQQFTELLAQLRADIAEVVRAHQGLGNLPADVAAEALATVLMSIVPGFIVQMALLGDEAVSGATDAVSALWPRSVSAER
jgi:TetR/AcrR family transcriptional regulator, transcriptional repressor of aconitase